MKRQRTLLLLFLTACIAVAFAPARATVPEFLPAEEIFFLDAAVADDRVTLDWKVADDHYVYVSRMAVRTDTPGAVLGDMVTPPGEVKKDRWFGEMEVLRGDIPVRVPVTADAGPLRIAATIQGCADAGLCYPPYTVTVDVVVPPGGLAGVPAVDLTADADSAGTGGAGTTRTLETVGAATGSLLGIRAASASETASESTQADREARVNSLRSALGLGGTAPAQSPANASPASQGAEEGGSALGALSNLGQSLGLSGGQEFLTPDEAFQLTERVRPDGTVELDWTIAPGYYLYRHQFRFDVVGGDGATLGQATMAPGKAKHDQYFGDVEVYYGDALARVSTVRTSNAGQNLELRVTWQGCADAGLCYPPAKRTIPMVLPASFTPGDGGAAMLRLTPTSATAAGPGAPALAAANAATATTAGGPAPMVSEQDRLTNLLLGDSLAFAMLAFFAGGLLLAFTPCVLPMIPILSSIIAGEGENVSRGRSFALSFIYVQGMAITYTAVGIVAGETGTNLQILMQQPWVLVTFAMVFVALALSMFGFYELQVPSGIQARLMNVSNSQKSGSLVGAGVMGSLSAVIVGPCVAPPLVGALGYIAVTGDSLLGGAALYALAMGMGVPLLAVGLFGGEILPRAGAWMDKVKFVFGIVMLAVAVWFLERVLPGWASMGLWAVLFIVTAIYMGALDQLQADSGGWQRFSKGAGLVTLVWGVMMLVGAGAGSTNPLAPLGNLTTVGPSASHAPVEFRQVKGIEGLRAAMREAAARSQPVMLDYYADWCVTCKEMEETTFVDAAVKEALRGVLVLQTDVTAVDDKDEALMKHFRIAGPPTIQFFTPDGEELRGYRIVGPMDAEPFRQHVTRAFSS